MFKWFKIVRFIKKYRKKDIASFRIVTNSNEIIIYIIDPENNIDDQIRLKYN